MSTTEYDTALWASSDLNWSTDRQCVLDLKSKVHEDRSYRIFQVNESTRSGVHLVHGRVRHHRHR